VDFSPGTDVTGGSKAMETSRRNVTVRSRHLHLAYIPRIPRHISA